MHMKADATGLLPGRVRRPRSLGLLAGIAAVEGANSLSWTQDERTLSFPWGSTQARLLSLGAPGGNLLTASRAAPAGIGHGWACTAPPVITPDGKTLACGARVSPAHSVPSDQAAGVAEYAAASGRPERVLGQRQSGPAGPVLYWENTSGSVLIGGIQGPYHSCPVATPRTVGVITGHRFVALPGLPELSIRSFAWLAAAEVDAAGEGGPGGPVGAVVGDGHGRLGVAQRVVGGQRAVVRVDLPVAPFAGRAGGELLAARLGHGDRRARDGLAR